MAYSQRLSAGIAQTISRRLNVNVLYSYGYRYELLIGRNLNAPVNGIRPNPEFANVVLASPDGLGRQHTVNASVNLNLAPMARAGAAAGRCPITIAGRRRDDVSGPAAARRHDRTTVGRGGAACRSPASTTLAATTTTRTARWPIPATSSSHEWGPSAFDRRHNGFVAITSNGAAQPERSPLVQRVVRATADDSHRPRRQRRPDLQRSSGRRRPQFGEDRCHCNSSANFGYSFTLGKKQVTSGGGVQIMGSPAGLTVNPTASQTHAALSAERRR